MVNDDFRRYELGHKIKARIIYVMQCLSTATSSMAKCYIFVGGGRGIKIDVPICKIIGKAPLRIAKNLCSSFLDISFMSIEL